MKLNLTASNKPQELILAYLQENASDTLAKKINNGVPVEKDGKTLISKKDLDGFMRFASNEAKQLADKGASSACVEDAVVYGWAIHYFEEDSIEGKLYNEDGTEYKPIVKTTPKATTKPEKVEPPKPTQQQASLWDMMSAEQKPESTEEETKMTLQANDHEVLDNTEEELTPEELAETADNPSIDEIADALQRAIDEQNKARELAPTEPKKDVPAFYTQYLELQECYPESIVLVRLGDFYEAFDGDAETLADELNLTLTSRKLTEDERVPMIGFPYHASDAYIAKIRKNHNMAIIEFNGDIVTLAKTVTADGKMVDTDTGEVLDEDMHSQEHINTETAEQTSPFSPSSFDEETAAYLLKLLNGKMDIVR